MKKLEIVWDKSDEKINELVDFVNLQEKRNDFQQSIDIDEFKYYEDLPNMQVECYSKKENEVIKKCLKYCRHRLQEHQFCGIHKALSCEDVSRFEDLIKKI